MIFVYFNVLTDFSKFAYYEYISFHFLLIILELMILFLFSVHLKTQIVLISLNMGLKEYLRVKYDDIKKKKLNFQDLNKNLKSFLSQKIIKSDLI